MTTFNSVQPPQVDYIAKLAQIDFTISSCLADLPLYNFQVEADVIVHQVEQVLRQQTTLPGVIISDNGEAIGIISRRKFFEQLGQLYGVAVFLKRPISIMLKAIGSQPLTLPSTTSVPTAIDLALHRPANFVFEPVIVELDSQIYRLLDVYTLLIAQSRLFARLQHELKTTNLELEDRVEERTLELQAANNHLTQEVSRRRKTEDELIVARDEAVAASRFKSELLAKVSHELRTPLGGILGHSEILYIGAYGPISAEQEEATAKIIKSTQYLTNMVNQLLDQAQLEAGKLQLNIGRYSPAELIEALVSKLGVLAESKGLVLLTEIAPDVPDSLVGDQIRVQQILINLTSNAIKFTQEGTIQVRLFGIDEEQWAIQVSDTGPGIPVEAQRDIFEPFRQVDGSETRQFGGTGLGLSIVQQLVTLMQGQIQLDSHLGQGATFTVFIPLQLNPKEMT